MAKVRYGVVYLSGSGLRVTNYYDTLEEAKSFAGETMREVLDIIRVDAEGNLVQKAW